MGSKGRISVAMALGFGLLSGMACLTTPAGDDNTRNANANASSNDNSGANNNSDTTRDRFRLKINWVGEGFGSSFFGAAVWVFIADDRVLRSEGNYREGPNTHRFIRDANNPTRLFELDIDAGKTVTLVAFDDAGKTLNLFAGATPEPSESTNQIEFVSIVSTSGDLDAMPETGVGVLVMDKDKEVTVTFRPMPTIVVRQLRAGRYNVQLETTGWLGDPVLGGISPMTTCTGEECDTACLGSTTWDGPVLHLAYKTGTKLTLTSKDCNAQQFTWDGWGVNDSCSGRTCTIIFGGTSPDPIAMWKNN